MNIIQENINNLTSLWQTVSEPYAAYHSRLHFDYALIKDSGWPNRLWFNKPLEDINPDQVRLHLMHMGIPLTVPLWGQNGDQTAFAKKAGLKLKSSQIGMSLPLSAQSFPEHQLTVRLVQNPQDAEVWSDRFKQAFGYHIHPKLLTDVKNTTVYLYDEGSVPVGTGILHKTNQIAGIHSIGVLPEMRRKGYAEKIMFHLLNEGIKLGSSLATLQASDLGKGLYLKLGFTEDFLIQSYLLDEAPYRPIAHSNTGFIARRSE
ncbi:GNAT family N-acetyltransferase [Reichenbachiella sp.]|uniref:GNAT family N-acetyltransferase n=1 Tax=Reichenbachiella sp. TaxID=2184521 RepID=UPI00329702D1